MFLHLFSHTNAGICSSRLDRAEKVAPDRALNLKDIYVKMQACIFCACIFEGHVYVLSESFLHLSLWAIFRQQHPNFRGGRNANASEIWAQLTKNHLTKSGTERFRENIIIKGVKIPFDPKI